MGERVIARARAAVADIAAEAPKRAVVLAVALLCLLLAGKVCEAVGFAAAGQAPWVVALFVLPLVYAFPGGARLLNRYRWPVLGVQATLTWVPLAFFGSAWETGFAGVLGGLVLLMVPGRVSWLTAGLLLTADLLLRAAATGLPFSPAWSGVVWVIITCGDDTVAMFGIVRLAHIVGEVDEARRRTADLAVAGERLRAAEGLQEAVGRRLAGIAVQVAAAREMLSRDAARAREQVAAAGIAAREAVAQARATGAGPARPAGPLAAPAATGAVVSARLAWAGFVVLLTGYAAQNLNNIAIFHDRWRLGTLMAAATVLTVSLQLHHSWSAGIEGRRPRSWPVTLALQAALVYMFFIPPIAARMVLPGFLAGSVLLLVPGRLRWAGFAAVVLSWTALYGIVPLHGSIPGDRGAIAVCYNGALTAWCGLAVYALSRLAGLARELEGLRGELVQAAVVQERLRVARDVHDLLGMNLSAIALKADLTDALIGRDHGQASLELEEIARICAVALADIRLITGRGKRMSLDEEVAAAKRILNWAGVTVSTDTSAGPLPAVADEVLAPVLREAVTNVLRHGMAATCSIQVTAVGGTLRLRVSNDGVPDGPVAARPATTEPVVGNGGGRGLANVRARVQAVGGQLTSRRASTRFDLAVEIPLADSALVRTGPAA